MGNDWYRVPSDLSGFGRGGGFGGFGGDAGALEFESVPVDLIGADLRASGCLQLAKGSRFSDYVNILVGFATLADVTLLDRLGRPTRVKFPELRVRLDDVAVIGQRERLDPPPPPDGLIPKKARRLLLMTETHIVDGSAYLHEQASLTTFVDATDPRFMPMTDVRVRWLSDRRLAGRFAFALIQRSRIIGVAMSDGAR